MNRDSNKLLRVNYKLIGGGRIKPYRIRVYNMFTNKSIDENI